jgi:hypothetical protein
VGIQKVNNGSGTPGVPLHFNLTTCPNGPARPRQRSACLAFTVWRVEDIRNFISAHPGQVSRRLRREARAAARSLCDLVAFAFPLFPRNSAPAAHIMLWVRPDLGPGPSDSESGK